MKRNATLIIDVVSFDRSPEEKAEAILDLVQDAIDQRRKALQEEAQQISTAAHRALLGERSTLRAARWYRTCSQLDILEPLGNSVGSILTGDQPIQERLLLIQEHLEGYLRKLMLKLCQEAQTISNDMEALALRVQKKGSLAQMCDIKSAQWYSTVSQIQALNVVYTATCEVVQVNARVVFPPLELDPSDDEGETDSATF
jgi:hypothetical protein